METVLTQWNFSPVNIALLLAATGAYYWLPGFKRQKRALFFWLGMGVFVLAACSPLHYLGMRYYFSAHMITHIMLLLVCGPLLVLSIPTVLPERLQHGVNRLSAFLYRRSWLGWMAGVGLMWCWHIPAVFDAAAAQMHAPYSILPLLHTAGMVLAGMLFCWPLAGPVPRYHIHPLQGVLYLFTACITCSLLGLLITFAPLGTYHHYIDMDAMMHSTGSGPWGLSRAADQQAAGLIMWVPCCFIYLAGCLLLLQRWFAGNTINTLSATYD